MPGCFISHTSLQDEKLIAWAAMACLSIAAKADEVCMPTHMLATQVYCTVCQQFSILTCS